MDIHRQVLPVHILGIGGAKLIEAGSPDEACSESRKDRHVAASASVYVLGIGLVDFCVPFFFLSFNHLTPQVLCFDSTKVYTMALSLPEASTTVYNICASTLAILSICAFLRQV